jgi:alpha/beta hydrolase fold
MVFCAPIAAGLRRHCGRSWNSPGSRFIQTYADGRLPFANHLLARMTAVRGPHFCGYRVASGCDVKRLIRIIAFAGAAACAALVPSTRADQSSIAYDADVSVSGQTPVRLHVEEHGLGRPLILLHGMGGSGYSFRRVIGALSRTNRVIVIDLKGFGASEKPFDLAYAPFDQAALIEAFLRQRRLTNVTLAGHSYGGAVALLTALRLQRTEPGRIRRLVLMNAPASPTPFATFSDPAGIAACRACRSAAAVERPRGIAVSQARCTTGR